MRCRTEAIVVPCIHYMSIQACCPILSTSSKRVRSFRLLLMWIFHPRLASLYRTPRVKYIFILILSSDCKHIAVDLVDHMLPYYGNHNPDCDDFRYRRGSSVDLQLQSGERCQGYLRTDRNRKRRPRTVSSPVCQGHSGQESDSRQPEVRLSEAPCQTWAPSPG